MTELSIRPEEIRDALQKYVADYRPEAAGKEEVGTVAQSATASLASPASRRRWPTSCWSSRTAPWASR